jgi:hypothetical protein
MHSGPVAVLLLWLASSCEATEPTAPRGLVKQARLGVFYGGQVQEREEVSRVLDQTRQSQGFRVTFRQPLRRKISLRWEVEMPGPPGRGAPVSVTKLGEVSVPEGRDQIDQILGFEPDDPLGIYNVRVLVAEELVLDRAWLVFDAAARKRALEMDPK